MPERAEFNTITPECWRKGLIRARKYRERKKRELKKLIERKINEQTNKESKNLADS
jgi:hypothetical protein